MGSLLVSPPASDTDARREFSTDEKGCASRQTATDKGSASAATEPRAAPRHTDNSGAAVCVAGSKRVTTVPFGLLLSYPVGCSSDEIVCLMVKGYWIW